MVEGEGEFAFLRPFRLLTRAGNPFPVYRLATAKPVTESAAGEGFPSANMGTDGVYSLHNS